MMESAMDVADLELDASTAHPEETTSQKLFSHLFEACNILRGPINQDEYKSYVTPILFFKRLSDVYTAYEDVIEKVKIVTIADIREKDYSLAINNYIEKKEQEVVPPEEIRKQYFKAYNEMLEAEARMRELLLEGGFISE